MPEAALTALGPSPASDPARLSVVSEAAPAAERAQAELLIPAYDLAAAAALGHELGVSHVLAQVLVRRGLSDPAAAREFLHPREAHDPGAFEGIDQAVATIERHVRAAGRIVVHGDYDVDGVCATAVTVRALRSLGADVGWFLPGRLEDGYGLSLETVERLSARGTTLLITVDCGITAVEEIAAARRAGMDVVLTDHHAPRADGRLPDCPIVHPVVCGYPTPDLCGTAVAHKLAEALGAATAPDDRELVALATVADLMPLRGENRRLVREGIAAMANTSRPGLRALMAVSSVDPSALDSGALGFRLAPRINAAGRIRRADAGLELLLTEDLDRAREIAEELDSVNAERRAVEQRIVWEAEALAARAGPRSAFVLAGEDWHPGVIGIVASRVVERHHRPTILIAVDRHGIGHGSGRSIHGFDLLGALHACAEHMERYGGHRAAAGLTIRSDRLPAFAEAFERHAEAVLTPDLLRRLERVDAIVSGSDLGLPLAEELEALEPCGMGNPGPRLLVPGARFGEVRTMGEGRHARFAVTSGGAIARAVAFGCDGRLAVPSGEPVDATFRLERNVYNGAVEPRLVLRHAQLCAPGPIEVIGEPEDYLAGGLRRDRPRAGGVRSVRAGARPHRPRSSRREPARRNRRRDRRRRRRPRGLRGRAAPPRRTGPLAPAVLRSSATTHWLPTPGWGLRSSTWSFSIPPPASRPTPDSARGPGLPIWPGAWLSYALRSRYMSWSTAFGLRSAPFSGVSGNGAGWPVRNSRACSAVTVPTAVRRGSSAD